MKYTFATLQTSSANDSLWRLSHSYVDMDEVRQTSNLIVTNTSLSTQDEIWSQLFLLFLQDSPPKPKIKKLAKAPTTPPETPPESPTLTYTTAPADTTAHRRGDHLLRDGTSSSSSSHQSKNRELFRIRSFESVSVVTLSSQSLWRQCHAMASFSICHTIFIGFIEPYCSCCFAHAGKFWHCFGFTAYLLSN